MKVTGYISPCIGRPETRVFILVALTRVNVSNWFTRASGTRIKKNRRFWAAVVHAQIKGYLENTCLSGGYYFRLPMNN